MDSYKWLQPDPMEVNNQLLVLLSKQMAGNDPGDAFRVGQDFVPPASAVRINTLWFLSITVSLSAGLIGIVCKQWIHEYQWDPALPSDEALALRQFRYLAWERWGVPKIIASPPILLQISLFLFLVGLVDMLWSQLANYVVASPASAVVGLLILLSVLTTCLPTMYHLWKAGGPWRRHVRQPASSPCPYKSPQSYLVLQVTWSFFRGLKLILAKYRLPFLQSFIIRKSSFDLEWSDLQYVFESCAGRTKLLYQMKWRALLWIKDVIGFNMSLQESLSRCISVSTPRVPCLNLKRHVGHTPLEECSTAVDPNAILLDLVTESDLNFRLELLIRDHQNGHWCGLSITHNLCRRYTSDIEGKSYRLPLFNSLTPAI